MAEIAILTRSADDGIVVCSSPTLLSMTGLGRDGCEVPEEERVVIEGLKIEMSSEQLAGRLAERIRWHAQTIEAYQKALLQSEVRGRAHRSVLEHQVREHQEQTAVLSLLREHLIPGEIYRLTECDLRFADLVPDPYLGSFVRPELDEEGAEVSADPA